MSGRLAADIVVLIFAVSGQSGDGDVIACADVRTLRRVGELDAEDFCDADREKALASAEASTSVRQQLKIEITCQVFS